MSIPVLAGLLVLAAIGALCILASGGLAAALWWSSRRDKRIAEARRAEIRARRAATIERELQAILREDG